MNHRDPELVYDAIPPAIREQAKRHPDPKVRLRADLEGIRDRAAADLKRIDGLLETCTDEMQETFLNIEHRAQTERLKWAEIFLRRVK